jgi:Rrf2 family nitric oxide-sensitive transcriptional repressor
MKLTSFTDYSLRVLIYLTVQPTPRATIAGIATGVKLSENHLVKVVHFLGRQGWLATVRGKGGGVALAQAPEDIVVGRVIRDTEGPVGLVECVGQTGCDCEIAPDCQLRGALGEAMAAFYAVLDGYTLRDLVRNRGGLATLLRLDAAPAPTQAPLASGSEC